jgi:4-hydroxybenzoate polyprenyltransferase
MKIAAALVAFFFLWLPFSVTALVAIVVSLLAILQFNVPYAKDLLRAMDRLGAAVFGWGGRYSVSAECGSRRSGCVFCRVACALLNLVQPGHCKGAADHEGLKP